MQIVIDIDKDVFERIKSGIPESVDCFKCEEAVLYGTPLPENHGRLIDADALDMEHEIEMADDWKTAHEIANCVKYAPTIIEGTEGKESYV